MAYDETLAQRIRAELLEIPGYSEKKMFGGIAFLFQGNMACGIIGNDLIVRVGADNYQAVLARPHTRVFDMTGRPMSGWVQVEAAGVSDETDLHNWIKQGVAFALSLPAK
jgi:TfoX/Sxy family transcriptional regulator of competence genes